MTTFPTTTEQPMSQVGNESGDQKTPEKSVFFEQETDDDADDTTGSTDKTMTPLKAIRAKCIECSNGSVGEVRKCVSPACPLFPFRMGHKPKTSKQRHQ